MATKPFPRGLRDRVQAVVNVAWSHPVLFFLIAALAACELGLTAYEVHKERENGYPSDEWRNRLGFLLFTACWTFLGAVLHWLVNLYVGGFWTVLTLVFWAVATDLWSHVEDFHPSDCDGSSIASFCRRVVAIEAIGWTELALTALLLLAVIFHWHSGGRKDNYRSAGYRGFYV